MVSGFAGDTPRNGGRMFNAIRQIYRHREDFIILGLAGKIGSGCTKVANFLAMTKENLNIPPKGLDSHAVDKDRKKAILHAYYEANWEPFIKLGVREIITTFILEHDYASTSKYVEETFPGIKIEQELKELYDRFVEKNRRYIRALASLDPEEGDFVYSYLVSELPAFTDELKKGLGGESYRNYSSVFQVVGDNIRRYGNSIPGGEAASNIYSIAQRLNLTIKLVRDSNARAGRKDYFVVDAFRNPFEVLFFQERFSAFYLMAIKAPEEDRKDRLHNELNLTSTQIAEQDSKEGPKGSIVDRMDMFVSQNIKACIQKADIHVINNGKHDNTNFLDLKGQLIKYVSLIQCPGLVTPSYDERMMQIAFTAKSNSGCISRQVGAVVTNADGAPVSIGWNDVPEGQVCCLFRTIENLFTDIDEAAYSHYEKSNKKFRANLKELQKGYGPADSLKGKPLSYCFKDIQNEVEEKDNQVYTRALHAEERAFLQIVRHGGQSVLGGTLYTTASPCDLCSKKAYHLGMDRIVFIEPYPGIAAANVLESGTKKINVVLYHGAIGYAYHKLYEPLLPYKDELAALQGDSAACSVSG